MSSKAGKQLVPALRFPEFQDSGAWGQKQLHEAAVFVKEKVALEKLNPQNYVSTENLLQDFMGMKPSSKQPSTGSATKFKINDVLISNIRPYLKKIWVAEAEGGASNDVIVIRPRNDVANKYLSQLLKSDPFIEYVMTGAKGVKMPRGDVELIKKFVVSIPKKPDEQEKIAACLSSLDDLISAQAQKIEALKAHKKGLMQQLFPAEGETVPRLRFPEFRDATGWEQRKLEELAKRGSGHTPSKSNTEYYDGGVKWVSLSDTSRLDNGLIRDTAKEISELGIKKSSAVLHPTGTVILSRDAGVGKSAVTGCPMAVSQHFIAWVCHPNKLHNWFLYYVLQHGKPLFERIATGSTIKTIGLPFFVELSIAVPSLSEQRKIADCLSSLDTLITTQCEKLEALKAHKKGLMQALFPAMVEGNE